MSVKNIIFHTCTNTPFDSEFAIRPATCRCRSHVTAHEASERILGVMRKGQMMRQPTAVYSIKLDGKRNPMFLPTGKPIREFGHILAIKGDSVPMAPTVGKSNIESAYVLNKGYHRERIESYGGMEQEKLCGMGAKMVPQRLRTRGPSTADVMATHRGSVLTTAPSRDVMLQNFVPGYELRQVFCIACSRSFGVDAEKPAGSMVRCRNCDAKVTIQSVPLGFGDGEVAAVPACT